MKQWEPKDYDAWYETPLGRISDRLEKDLIFSLASVKQGEKALDAGCGTGVYSIELSKKGAVTTGTDISENMLGLARAKARKDGLKIDFVAADALALPFRDDYFDLVLSVGMLCFVKEREKALLEMRRVLKPGGRVVAGVLNKWSSWALLRRIKGLFKETVYNRAQFISPPALESSLRKAGFEVKEIKTCLFFLPVNCGAYLKRAARFERLDGIATPRMGAEPLQGAFLAALAVKK